MSPINSRHSIQNQKSESAGPSNGLMSTGFSMRGVNSSSPIRLNVNRSLFNKIILLLFSIIIYLFCDHRKSDARPKIEQPEPEFESPMSKSFNKKFDPDIPSSDNSNSTVSLESIVTEYLTNQHASCKHPMVTCPQFNLFV